MIIFIITVYVNSKVAFIFRILGGIMPNEECLHDMRTQLSDRRAGETALTMRINAINERLGELMQEMKATTDYNRKLWLVGLALLVGKDNAMALIKVIL
jgi:hypothetical protein